MAARRDVWIGAAGVLVALLTPRDAQAHGLTASVVFTLFFGPMLVGALQIVVAASLQRRAHTLRRLLLPVQTVVSVGLGLLLWLAWRAGVDGRTMFVAWLLAPAFMPVPVMVHLARNGRGEAAVLYVALVGGIWATIVIAVLT